jgi:site-specific DNA recombinase
MVRDGRADTLLVVDLDRLARDPRDLEDAIELVEHYRAVVADVSGALDLSTDHGVFLARLMVAHANLSSRDTSRRIRRARLADAEAGRPHRGFRAFGYAADGVSVVEEEAALIREAYDRLLAGASGYAVVTDWNRRGLLTPRGRPWKYATFRQVLTNPRVAGLASRQRLPAERGVAGAGDEFGKWMVRCRADGSEVLGCWPAIVERARWEAVCAAFSQTARRAGAGTARNTRKYLLSGLLRCGLCGGAMYGQTHRTSVLYVCHGRTNATCRGVSGRAAPLEEHIAQAALAKYEAEIAGWEQAAGGERSGWPGAAELARVERKLSEAYGQWKSDALDGAAYFTMRADLEAGRSRLAREQAAWARAAAESADSSAGPVDARAAWTAPVEEGGWSLPARREFLFRQLLAVQYTHPTDPVTGKRLRRIPFDPGGLRLIWREPETGTDPATIA